MAQLSEDTTIGGVEILEVLNDVADKPTLDQIKTLIGPADPGSGDLTTLFRGIKLLTNYVDELETRLTATRAGKLDLMGTAGDGAGTGTVFARLAQIAGYTDTLESALASLSASMGRSFSGGTFSTTSSTLQTALSLTGQGCLEALMTFNPNVTSISDAVIKVTIDGAVIINSTFSPSGSGTPSGSQTAYFYYGGFIWSAHNNGYSPSSLRLEYKSSLLIQISSSEALNFICKWGVNK